MTGKELIQLVQSQGWVLVRIKGSHHIFQHPNYTYNVVVPVHGKKEISKGTENDILKLIGLK
jgi:predicted RNA binding protein YcfA (HicA-like mRNA interferase family)